MTRFYRKTNPTQRVYLSDGRYILFPASDDTYGYLAINNEGVQKEFDQLMARGTGGVDEISGEQYADGIKKKPLTDSPPSSPREELGKLAFANQILQDRAVAGPAPVEGDGSLQVAMPVKKRPVDQPVEPLVHETQEAADGAFRPIATRFKR